VVDFETIGAAEPEYDLRAFPGPGTGPRAELQTRAANYWPAARAGADLMDGVDLICMGAE
jgi:hypothetical protein